VAAAALEPSSNVTPEASVVDAQPEPESQPEPGEPPETWSPSPSQRRRRGGRVAGGVAAALLVAGGAAAALLLLTRDDDSTQSVSTLQLPAPATTTTEPPSTVSSPTAMDRLVPQFEAIGALQADVNARVRSLDGSAASLEALRQAADALATDVAGLRSQAVNVGPADEAEAKSLALLHRALAAHLSYADAVASLPARPEALTRTHASTVNTLADEARFAYVDLALADATFSSVYVNTGDHERLLTFVNPTPVPPVRQPVDLVPLLVGLRPDDALGEGRCFGPYTPRASLRVSGVVYRSGFIQCGDDENGDPGRASGVYRFSGRAFPSGSRLARVTGQVAIDESSSPSQRGSRVTWTVSYDGTPLCSQTVVWSGSRPSPKSLDCRISSSASSSGVDIRRLRIEQVAWLASTGSLWAGLLRPTIVVEVPR
jgi:hypothetical protein